MINEDPMINEPKNWVIVEDPMINEPKNWVIVRWDDGIVKVWRDFGACRGEGADGTAWESSPHAVSGVYDVLGYYTGSYGNAWKYAKTRNRFPIDPFDQRPLVD